MTTIFIPTKHPELTTQQWADIYAKTNHLAPWWVLKQLQEGYTDDLAANTSLSADEQELIDTALAPTTSQFVAANPATNVLPAVPADILNLAVVEYQGSQYTLACLFDDWYTGIFETPGELVLGHWVEAAGEQRAYERLLALWYAVTARVLAQPSAAS